MRLEHVANGSNDTSLLCDTPLSPQTKHKVGKRRQHVDCSVPGEIPSTLHFPAADSAVHNHEKILNKITSWDSNIMVKKNIKQWGFISRIGELL